MSECTHPEIYWYDKHGLAAEHSKADHGRCSTCWSVIPAQENEPNKMNEQERAYATELFAGALLLGFRELLNPELSKAIADIATEKISVIQAYNGKTL